MLKECELIEEGITVTLTHEDGRLCSDHMLTSFPLSPNYVTFVWVPILHRRAMGTYAHMSITSIAWMISDQFERCADMNNKQLTDKWGAEVEGFRR